MFRSLRNLLKERLREYSFADEILATKVLDLWQKTIEEELGPNFSKDARALYFKNGILNIKVANSTLLQELKLRDKVIIEKINSFLERNFINPQKLKKIIYKLG